MPNLANNPHNVEEMERTDTIRKKDKERGSVFLLDNQELLLSQDPGYDTLIPFRESKVFYNDKFVGRAARGESTNNFTDEVLNYQRENATFFSLVRNEDFRGIAEAIESVEYRFNNKYHYDWVFANDEPFHPTFIKVIENLVSGKAHFVQIPQEIWSYPDWIDQDKANETRHTMKQNKVKYGDSESYRHMCRFNSGFFYRLPIMKKYRYYWRVEPEIEFQCDIFDQDWFKYMKENNKKYAFTLAPLELHTTVTNLWETVQDFSRKNPKLVAKDNNMEFLTEDGGVTYNMCHFWSNFEIGDMDFYRLDAYSKFFDHIDRAGGFYYSRWGDAPIHSMGVSLLLSKDELFYMDNSGYFHSPNGDCPWDPEIRKQRRCTCQTKKDASWLKSSCIPKWFEIHNIEKPPFVPKFKFVNQHKPPDEEEEEEREKEEDYDDKDE
ncbi:uncharacterized protein AC631_00894 [Debaryomyces fabryi]|uniref:Uncharacterized protein n=1 Tax=Debaryomyces fabryi TaxID=58627 RepID=A0A0V1Q4G7_9ASCO|nr:uncharacterized protein AC631_00894 [Debaryomyces fabryi]KSA03409.1 hypothetical protein AC631_00894 [Debaryomyces fabryi]CUM50042.1 unnamed protein product [Debaryomyces fabryi]